MCDPVSEDKEAESSTHQRDLEKIKVYQNLKLFFKNQCGKKKNEKSSSHKAKGKKSVLDLIYI